MCIRLYDVKRNVIFAEDVLNDDINLNDMRTVLSKMHFFVDEFGNVKNLFGEFMQINISSLRIEIL